MKVRKELFEKRPGFTIVELLTVMSVIAILIGLLVPALNLVKDFAKEVQQRAQFHSIGVGLDMFNTEFGYYPPSDDNADIAHPHLVDQTPYGGAQKLAEAVVGWDLLGFHPQADFRSDGRNDIGAGDVLIYDATILANVEARKGPFVELENANAYTMEEVYGSDVGSFDPLNYVLCDEYSKKRLLGKKTGMPILYYRAHTNRIFQDAQKDDSVPPSGFDTDDDIYEYGDNDLLIQLGSAAVPSEIHPLDITTFDQMIRNPQVTTITRPFRAGSYILISAGKDGLYGNADDIFNFDKE